MNLKVQTMMLFSPTTVREQALGRSALFAVGINAGYGILALGAFAFSMLSMFTVGFVLAVSLLFGPLLGFVVSSLYPRVEMTVGRRLGGEATLDELYRLFAWSFFPAGLALLLLVALYVFAPEPAVVQWLLSLPLLVLFGLGIRNYGSNVIAAQQFTLARGGACLVLTLILFAVLMTAGVGFVDYLLRLGAGESLSTILFSKP